MRSPERRPPGRARAGLRRYGPRLRADRCFRGSRPAGFRRARPALRDRRGRVHRWRDASPCARCVRTISRGRFCGSYGTARARPTILRLRSPLGAAHAAQFADLALAHAPGPFGRAHAGGGPLHRRIRGRAPHRDGGRTHAGGALSRGVGICSIPTRSGRGHRTRALAARDRRHPRVRRDAFLHVLATNVRARTRDERMGSACIASFRRAPSHARTCLNCGSVTPSTHEPTPHVAIGGRPAGLLLSHLLHREGIDSVGLETRAVRTSRGTIRAGVARAGDGRSPDAHRRGERIPQ